MKKIFGMLSLFLSLGFVVCVIFGFALPLEKSIFENSSFAYKMCRSLKYFFMFLPALIFTGFVVSYTVHFGHNSEGSVKRFSAAMINRLKMVMISCFACVFVLTLVSEAFTLFVDKKMKEIENKPALINEYIVVANSLYVQGFASRAQRYAQAALALDPKSQKALEISQKAEIKIKAEEISTHVVEAPNEKKSDIKIDESKIKESTAFLNMAKQAFENEKWFDAHYFAQKGIMLLTSKDPNAQELRSISAQAWNSISAIHDKKKTTDQLAFEEKYKGYVALTENNDLKAYYIFKGLSERSDEFARDSEVVFYLDIAQKRVLEKSFFIDETLELNNFEQENNVHFIHTYPDDSKAIWFFKGLSSVDQKGYAVQYLRDFYIMWLDKDGKYETTLHTPYAKILPIPVSSLDEETKELYGITDSMKSIPYILLKSVDRSDSSVFYVPEYKYENGKIENTPEFMFFPIAYSDFIKLEQSAGSPQTMPLSTLTSLAFKSKDFGFAQELYGYTVLNRFLYPLCMLILLVFLSSFAWNNRIGDTQYFKFSWLMSMPILIFMFLVLYYVMIFLFHLINYTFVSLISGIGSLFAACGFYLLLLIVAMIYFLARRSKV